DHYLIAQSYDELANVDLLEGKLAAARSDAERALAIRIQTNPKGSPALAESYRIEAKVLLALGRPAEARRAVETAQECLAGAGGGEATVQAGLVLALRAEIALRERQPAVALAMSQRALALLEGVYGPDGRGLVDTLLGFGQAQLDLGDGAAAL